MQMMQNGDLPYATDMELIAQLLPLPGARILELGCGAAFTTRRIAEDTAVAEIIATEVDQIQHAKNLAIGDLPKVRFMYAGMEALDLADASIDGVIMLKSLHHVPREIMDAGFVEVARVLRPGGLMYISEPVYAGAFNEILRLFNDEQQVRIAAFTAIERAVQGELFALETEVHFNSISRFQGFEDFERRILGATHSNFDVDPATYAEVKGRFLPRIGGDGIAEFHNPMRVDVLRRL